MIDHLNVSNIPVGNICELLKAGRTVLALGVRHARTGDIARMAYGAGYALVWIDLEHSSMPIDCAAQIASTARDLGLTAWVRVPEREYGLIGRLLDCGATGIIAPRIETVEEAASVATAARFPPRGQRSQIGLLPQFEFRRMPASELTRKADAETVVQVLIETERGVANADAIAALDGVDVLGVGMNDLSADLGCTGDLRNPRLNEACARVAMAARRHGKIAVVGGVTDEQHYGEILRLGVAPLIFAGTDTDLLAASLVRRAADWETHLAREKHADN